MTLNGDQMDALWDLQRDGELSDDQRRAFEEALAQDPKRARVWEQESAWLEVLGHAEHGRAVDDRFTNQVWQRHRAIERRDVLVRLGGWAAAAAAVLVMAVVLWQDRGATSGEGVSESVAVNAAVQPPEAVDPLSALLREANVQISQEPERWTRAVDQTTSVLDLGVFMAALDDVEPMGR